jgi:threonine dehydratase
VPAPDGSAPLDLSHVEWAREAGSQVVQTTPVFGSRWLSEATAGPVVLKAENLQRTGSFKIRGATAKLASLGDAAQAGTVAASAGNHAQAVALAAQAAGVSCEVFMPRGASIGKVAATRSYGAGVRLEGESLEEALELATARAAEAGLVLVHPFDDPAVIAGQATLGLEIVEQVPELARLVVPLGGGGLAGGVAFAVKALRPTVQVVAVQAAACAPFQASVAAHHPVAVEAPVATLADGIAVRRPGDLTLPLVERYVDAVVTVDENEIAAAMVMLLERAKLVVEGAGAVGVAAMAAPSRMPPPTAGGTTVVVLSGGNVDANLLWPAIRRNESLKGRRIVLWSRVSDRPGHLAKLLTCIGSTGANIVDVVHLREGYDLEVRETALHLTLETRDAAHAEAVMDACRTAGYDVRRIGN